VSHREKKTIDDLAIFGGNPLFDEPLHVGRPNVGDIEATLSRFRDILETRRFTNFGPYVREFEQRICEFTGAKHCVSACNATIGLEIASRAAGFQDEIIVPAFTFVATAHAMAWQGMRPVFCDIDPETHNIDPEQVEQLITSNTGGICATHLWGQPCNIDALEAIAKRHSIPLIFDAAHAFGSTYNGSRIGNFGDAEVFSFHATKVISTFEGGAIVTNSPELAEKARLMTNFGFSGQDNVIYLGTNGKMSEVSAAMGLSMLDALPDISRRNRENHRLYAERLKDISGISLTTDPESQTNTHQYVVTEVTGDAFGLTRDELLTILKAENILARRYFYPGCANMAPYATTEPLDHGTGNLPRTSEACEKTLILPTGPSATEEIIRALTALVALIAENAEQVQQRTATC
jgi:dTDP-4-amino-4,6-dideoxygalactose transaminase